MKNASCKRPTAFQRSVRAASTGEDEVHDFYKTIGIPITPEGSLWVVLDNSFYDSHLSAQSAGDR